MQQVERQGRRDGDPSPDGRLGNAAQGDLELVDVSAGEDGGPRRTDGGRPHSGNRRDGLDELRRGGVTRAAQQRQRLGRLVGVRVPERRGEHQRREFRGNRGTGGAERLDRQPGLISGVFGHILTLLGEPHPRVGAEAGPVRPLPPGRRALVSDARGEGYRGHALSGVGMLGVGQQFPDRRDRGARRQPGRRHLRGDLRRHGAEHVRQRGGVRVGRRGTACEDRFGQHPAERREPDPGLAGGARGRDRQGPDRAVAHQAGDRVLRVLQAVAEFLVFVVADHGVTVEGRGIMSSHATRVWRPAETVPGRPTRRSAGCGKHSRRPFRRPLPRRASTASRPSSRPSGEFRRVWQRNRYRTVPCWTAS